MSNRLTIKHSKVKNTAILFEMLVRQVAKTALSVNENSNDPAIRLIQKYFSPNTELGKELQLYHLFTNNNIVLTESKAVQLIDLVVSKRKMLNESKLAREKYNLVKEIKETYDVNAFFGYKIKNYKLLASVYKLFLSETSDFYIRNLDTLVESHLTLATHLLEPKKLSKPNVIYELLREQSEDIRLLSYKILMDKFNEKYKTLTNEQKELLREYINHVSGTSTFNDYVIGIIPSLRDRLDNKSKTMNDKILKIKLHEVVNQLNVMKSKKVLKESDVVALMISYQIDRELDK